MNLTDEQVRNRVGWVRDLLSGNFRQGQGALRTGEEGSYAYCCLGVACERVDPNNFALRAAASFMDYATAKEYFGLMGTEQNVAARWNDTESYTFERIADLIAYATAMDKALGDFLATRVPDGFAVEWLKQFD